MRGPATTESGPVLQQTRRRCKSLDRTKHSHKKWTRARGPVRGRSVNDEWIPGVIPYAVCNRPAAALPDAMSGIVVQGDPEALEYLELIATRLQEEFGIGRMEAIGRINRFWNGMDLTPKYRVDALLHESLEAWANMIYFGPDTRWWDPNAPRTPVPFP